MIFFEYKKPGGWVWLPQHTVSLERDIADGAFSRDGKFRVDGQELDITDFLRAEGQKNAQREYQNALTAYQAEPLPPIPEFPAPTSPLGVLLARYLSRYVGVNYRDTKKFDRALLTRVSDDFFTVFAEENQTNISFPLRHVLSVVEAEKGVSKGWIFPEQFCVVIEVYHLVVYSGSVGVVIPL